MSGRKEGMIALYWSDDWWDYGAVRYRHVHHVFNVIRERHALIWTEQWGRHTNDNDRGMTWHDDCLTCSATYLVRRAELNELLKLCRKPLVQVSLQMVVLWIRSKKRRKEKRFAWIDNRYCAVSRFRKLTISLPTILSLYSREGKKSNDVVIFQMP